MSNPLHLARVKIPQEWKDAIEAEGYELSEFVRDAMVSRFKKLKIDVPKASEINRGRPRKPKDK